MEDINTRADATSFQTGNVFYEVLFSAINKDFSWASYLYFGFSVLTLVCGTIGVSFATQLSRAINGLETDEQKSYFAYTFRDYESKLAFVFVMSLYFWLFALAFSSTVKYDSRWYISSSWSFVGLVLVTHSIVYMEKVRKLFRKVSLVDPFLEEKERLCIDMQRIWRAKKVVRSKREQRQKLIKNANKQIAKEQGQELIVASSEKQQAYPRGRELIKITI